LWDDAKKVVLPISLKARESGINTVVSLWTPSMKEQILKANRSWAKYIVIVWFMEAKNWIFQVRNVEAGTQEEIKKEELIDYIIDKIGKDSLDFYCPARDLLTE
jgi:histidyl-tRNA synthetase